MSEVTVTRVGERITKIRFEVHAKPLIEYAAIVAKIPDGKAKREWLAKPVAIDIKDGWAEAVQR
jgi:hypothetical protein